MCVTPYGEMPHQLLRWFRQELAVVAFSWADREPTGSPPPSADVRGRGSRPTSDPCLVGSSSASRGFKALPLSFGYAFMFPFVLIVEFLSVTNLRLFDSDQVLAGLVMSPPPMREEWRPSLWRVAKSEGEAGWWWRDLP